MRHSYRMSQPYVFETLGPTSRMRSIFELATIRPCDLEKTSSENAKIKRNIKNDILHNQTFLTSCSYNYSDGIIQEVTTLDIDKELILRMQNGDLEARDQFIESIYPHIYRYIRSKVNDYEEAKDITQDVCLSLIRNAKFIRSAHAKSYIFTSANNRCIDYYRRKGKEP